MSEAALQIAEERRKRKARGKVKDKPNGKHSCKEQPGEKAAFLSVQSRETEGSSDKTRELFKK